ncbi:iron chaperone [Lentzea sp. NPDC055074]
MAEVDDYFAELDAPARAAFERIRALAERCAPDAEQGTSYGMAALRLKGKPLLGFKAAKDHLAVFPFSPAAVDVVRERLAGFSLSKGTVRFTVDHPLPDDVVRDLVRQRMGEIG